MITRLISRRWHSKVVEKCPAPGYDTGCTFCGVGAFPHGKHIDYERNLNGTSVLPWKHALVLSHGHKRFETMPARLEMDAGSLVAEISAIRRRVLSPEHPVLVANASVGEMGQIGGAKQVVYLFPDRKLVEFDIEHTAEFVQRYLVPEGWEPAPVFNPFLRVKKGGVGKAGGWRDKSKGTDGPEKPVESGELGKSGRSGVAENSDISNRPEKLVSSLGPRSSTVPAADENDSGRLSGALSPFRETSLSRDLVLICAHAQRDVRCGEIAPLLKAEFAQVLRRERLQDHVDVGYISHVGGHAYAGNVVYLPADLDRAPVWYGRVFPEKVQGLVQETIIKGNVIRELYRGSTESL